MRAVIKIPDYICHAPDCSYIGDDVAREDRCRGCGELYAPNEDGNSEVCPLCGSGEYLLRCPSCGADEEEGFANTGFMEPKDIDEILKAAAAVDRQEEG